MNIEQKTVFFSSEFIESLNDERKNDDVRKAIFATAIFINTMKTKEISTLTHKARQAHIERYWKKIFPSMTIPEIEAFCDENHEAIWFYSRQSLWLDSNPIEIEVNNPLDEYYRLFPAVCHICGSSFIRNKQATKKTCCDSCAKEEKKAKTRERVKKYRQKSRM